MDNERAERTILLVDDDHIMRALTARILRQHNYAVLEASTDVEALTLTREKRCEIELVLSDVVVPEMGGQDLAREIRARCPRLPVLLMSGYGQSVAPPDDSAERLRGPALVKPFTRASLLGCVEQALQERGVESN